MSKRQQDDPAGRTSHPGASLAKAPPWGAIIVGLVAILTFGWSVTFGFMGWDDRALILENQFVRHPSLSSLRTIWTEPYVQIYMPVTYSLWMLEAWPAAWIAQLRGIGTGVALDPALYHAVTVFLFAAAAVQVYRLTSRFVADRVAAVLGSLLFCVHPLQVEPACWLSENKGLLSILFGVSALIYYVDFTRAASPEAGRRPYVIGLIFMTLALLSKPSAVAFPLVAVVLDRFLQRRSITSVLTGLLPWFLLAILMIAITKFVQTSAETIESPLIDRPYVAADALGFYAWKLVWPVGLGPDYGRSPEAVIAKGGPTTLLGWGSWIAILGIIVGLWMGKKWSAVAILLAILFSLLPNLGFLTFAFQGTSTVADRYAAPAFVPLSLGLAMLLAQPKLRLIRWGAPVLWAGLGVLTVMQSAHWSTNDALNARALEIHPKSFAFLNNRSRDRIAVQDFQGAAADARAAIELKPSMVKAYYNLALASVGQSDWPAVMDAIDKIQQIEPGEVSSLQLIVQAFQVYGQYKQAIPYARQLAKTIPAEQARLARLLVLAGERKEGLDLFLAYRTKPATEKDREEIEAQIFEQAGEWVEAINRYRTLMQRYGGSVPLTQVRLAWLLATVPDENLRQPGEALEITRRQLTRALSKDEPVPAMLLDIHAAVLASNGEFESAIKYAEEAEAAAKQENNVKLAQKIALRRQLYQSNEPFRESRPTIARGTNPE